jgi:hypothetical protein
MFRVVTKAMVTRNGIRTRQVDAGPWQPSEGMAKRWAQYLQATGLYDSVSVHSNGQTQSVAASEDDFSL